MGAQASDLCGWRPRRVLKAGQDYFVKSLNKFRARGSELEEQNIQTVIVPSDLIQSWAYFSPLN